jgi:predicted DNA-binding transcriptional regulator AlpA
MSNQKLSPSSRVRERCGGISEMTLWRWRQDPDLAFPTPVTIRGRNFYDDDEITEFLDRQKAASSADAKAA